MNPSFALDLNDALARFGGRREALLRTAKAFVQAYSDVPEQLKQHAGASAWHLLSEQAHRIKGSAAVLGARELARLAGDLEDALRDGDRDDAIDLAPQMTAALEAALLQMDQLELPAPSSAPPGAVAELAARLPPLLQSGDFAAGPLLDQLAAQLSGSEYAARVETIRRHFEALDTDDAAILADSLKEALEARQ